MKNNNLTQQEIESKINEFQLALEDRVGWDYSIWITNSHDDQSIVCFNVNIINRNQQIVDKFQVLLTYSSTWWWR